MILGLPLLKKHLSEQLSVGHSVSRGVETFPVDMPFLSRLQLQRKTAGLTGFPLANFRQIS